MIKKIMYYIYSVLLNIVHRLWLYWHYHDICTECNFHAVPILFKGRGAKGHENIKKYGLTPGSSLKSFT
jgi:hypothetical protein